MSHYAILVITPEESASEIYELLAPYDENMEVESYPTECGCIGREAVIDTEDAVAKKFGTMDELRERFWKGREPAATDEDWDRHELEWQELIKPRKAYHKKLLESHPKAKEPAPTCTACSGKGIHYSTYNPKSKWDWFAIGGRWDGSLNGENVAKVSEVIAQKWYPFAIVTPDGEWHERGEMGWFGLAMNEKLNSEWNAEVDTILAKYPDHIATVVDCHI